MRHEVRAAIELLACFGRRHERELLFDVGLLGEERVDGHAAGKLEALERGRQRLALVVVDRAVRASDRDEDAETGERFFLGDRFHGTRMLRQRVPE